MVKDYFSFPIMIIVNLFCACGLSCDKDKSDEAKGNGNERLESLVKTFGASTKPIDLEFRAPMFKRGLDQMKLSSTTQAPYPLGAAIQRVDNNGAGYFEIWMVDLKSEVYGIHFDSDGSQSLDVLFLDHEKVRQREKTYGVRDVGLRIFLNNDERFDGEIKVQSGLGSFPLSQSILRSNPKLAVIYGNKQYSATVPIYVDAVTKHFTHITDK